MELPALRVQTLPVGQLVGLLIGATLAYQVSKVIYNIYFHPLRKFPGPKSNAASSLPLARARMSGRYHEIDKELHDKYGPAVRVSPNVISFSSAQSWKDIYGHTAGRKPFLKSLRYAGNEAPNLVTVRDPHKHAEMKKFFNAAFSARALEDQEDIVQSYVDLFVRQINTHGTEPGSKGTEMTAWYNFFTFDIIGDLAFGDPFGCLADGKPHFWVSLLLPSLKAGSYTNALRSLPLGRHLGKLLAPKEMKEARVKHFQYSADKARKRMARTDLERKDFWTDALAHGAADKMTEEEIISQSRIFIVAGSETTATFLSGVTYHLCRTPSAYKKLVDEIRTSFKSYDDINGRSTQHLHYLKAVIDEGLRIYPPVPIGLGRLSPGETVDGHYLPEGTVCFTHAWSATHSEENFHKPYEFIPERWIDPTIDDKKMASQPFSMGSRVCIGQNLALLEMRVLLSKMLWTFDMELTDEGLDWDRDNVCVSLWAKPKLMIKFNRRPGTMIPEE